MNIKQCARRKKETGQKCGVPFEGTGSYCKKCRNEYQKEYNELRKTNPARSRATELGIGCDVCGVALRSNTLEVIDHPMLEKNMTLCGPCRATITYAGQIVDEETTEAIIDAIMALSRVTHTSTEPFVATVTDHYAQPATSRSEPIRAYVKPSAEEMAARAARIEAEIDANLARGREQQKALEATQPVTDAAVEVPKETPLTFEYEAPYVPTITQPGEGFVECGACNKEARPGMKFCEDCKGFEK